MVAAALLFACLPALAAAEWDGWMVDFMEEFDFVDCYAVDAEFSGADAAIAFCLNASLCLRLHPLQQCVQRYRLQGKFGQTECGYFADSYAPDIPNFGDANCTGLGRAAPTERERRLQSDNDTTTDTTDTTTDDTSDDTAPIYNASNGTNATYEEPYIRRSFQKFVPCIENDENIDPRRVEAIQRLLDNKATGMISFVALSVSPNRAPVHGGTHLHVCGMGFKNTNENINSIRCKFYDDFHSKVVFGAYMNSNQISCTSPDFSHFSIGLPHKVFVEVSLNKGQSWTNNKVSLILFGVRTSTDALGFPMWGYEETFTKASWQVEHVENLYGFNAPVFYPSSKSLELGVDRKPTDSLMDPYHTDGLDALDTTTRGEPFWEVPEDVDLARELSVNYDVEGSWGDPNSFYRAHYLVKDTYRQDVLAAQMNYADGAL